MTWGSLRVTHLSGKWSATPGELRAALNAIVDEHGADVITLTEVQPEDLGRAIREWCAGHGWHLQHPKVKGAAECAILSRLPLVARRRRQLTKLGLRIGRKDPTFLVSAHVVGWGWFSVLHTPAHTGGLRRFGRYRWPTRVYYSILETLAIVQLRMRMHWTVLMDANLDLRRPVIRSLFGRVFPGLQVINPIDQQITEGGRVIDGGVTNLRVLSCVTGSRLDGFDHRPVHMTFTRPA